MKWGVLSKLDFGFSKLMQLAALTLYTVFMAVLLVFFEANILVVVALLSVLPTVVLWRLERLNSRLLPIMLLLTIALTVVYESTAYINGIWYETSPSEWRVFGLFPVEAFVAAFSHLLYFVVLYEYFFDDRASSGTKTDRYTKYVVAAAGLILATGLAYVYLFSHLIITNAFAAILFDLVALVVIVSAIARKYVWPVLGKTALFALAIYPSALAYEYVALANNLRFFANPSEYVYSFTVLNQVVPIEELVFLFLVPFVTALVYELYLDDGK